VHVTYRPITSADLDAGVGSVIGVPIPDLQLFLLDERRRPVPTGVAAELYVGGAGVAQGYLNRPDLTAERFLPNEFANGDRSRLYRTGDLARRVGNGDLEYLGRIDDQVKIRGFRIELGEIEAVLRQQHDVTEAVVVAREDRPGDQRLVAYLTPSPGAASGLVDRLRTELRRTLPEYMVPLHFIPVEAIPLTPNGKVDRKALPAPDAEAMTGTQHVAPRNPTESRIATVWADALGVADPGIDDDFFDLGGHSLTAAQVVNTLRSAFHVDVAMRHLFERPTIAGLAQIIDVLAVSRGGDGGSARDDAGIGREEIEI
jgi:acyl carrier protein